MWSVELLKTLVLAPVAVCSLLVARACGGWEGWVVWLAMACVSVSVAAEMELHKNAGARDWKGTAAAAVLWGSAALSLGTAQYVSMDEVNRAATALFFVVQLMTDAMRLHCAFARHRALLLALELFACAALGLRAVLGADACESGSGWMAVVFLGRVSAATLGSEASVNRESRTVVVEAKMSVPDVRDFLAV